MIFSRNREEEEINLARQGENKAIKALYDRHVGYLTAVCSRYIIGYDDLQDVLQESFIKIFSQLDAFQYRGKGSLRAWMARVMVNESLKYLRKHEQICSICPTEDLPDMPEDTEPNPNEISPEALQGMIRELPTGYRVVLNLYVFEQRSHKEIAEMLHIKESTSASQLHKAKDMLAQKIAKFKNQNHG